MRLSDIKKALGTVGYPVAYHHFAPGEVPELPFIVYYVPEGREVGADNLPFVSLRTVRTELYTDRKDPEAECKVRAALSSAGLYPQLAGETYITSGKMYLNAYESEVILDE